MTTLAVVALAMLLFATYLLGLRLYVWDAALLLCISIAGLLVALSRTSSRPKLRLPRPKLPLKVRDWLPYAALLLSLVVMLSTRGRAYARNFTLPFFVWISALLLFSVTLCVPLISQGFFKIKLSRAEAIALGILLVFAALLRGLKLGTIPANFGGDEGTQLLASVQLVQSPLGNPFATGWYSVPTMSFLAYGEAMRVFGATVAGGRALSALVGTLTVLTTFWLGRMLGGRRVGWAAALVLTFSAYHIHYSRLASNQIFDPFIGTLVIALLWLALRGRRSEVVSAPLWGLAGIVTGLGWYTYFGARWVTVLVFLIVLWRSFLEPRLWVRHRRGLLLFVLGWLVVTLPLLGWYSTHPSAFVERYNAVSVFASGWLAREMVATGKPALPLLLKQFWKSVTAFHLTPDPTFWYFPQQPLVDFVTGALLLVGMLVAVLRWRWPTRTLTLIWFWPTLVMAWTMTENPPSSQRGLLLMPSVALLAGWGISALWDTLACHRDVKYALLGVLLAAIIVLNVGFYFAIYTPRRSYGNPTAEKATEIARFVQAFPARDAVIYFFGAPELYWDFGALAFMLRDQQGVNMLPGEFPQAVVAPARFIVLPLWADDLETIKTHYPGGTQANIRTPDGRLMAYIYDWVNE